MIQTSMATPGRKESPDELFTRIRSELRGVLIGQNAAADRLALVATAHLCAPAEAAGMLRWVIGPTGCGKTSLIHALGPATGLPLVRIDATRVTASGWEGTDPESVLAVALRNVPVGSWEWRRPIVVLDDAQHLRVKTVADRADQAHQLNRQAALLTLLCGTGPFSVRVGSGPQPWTARGALRIVAGSFDLDPERAGSPAALQEWGFIPEFANRLAQPAIHLAAADTGAVRQLLLPGPYSGPLLPLVQALGGTGVVVQPDTASAVAWLLAGDESATPRTAWLMLEAAIERKVLQLLSSGVLHPDRAPVEVVVVPADIEAV